MMIIGCWILVIGATIPFVLRVGIVYFVHVDTGIVTLGQRRFDTHHLLEVICGEGNLAAPGIAGAGVAVASCKGVHYASTLNYNGLGLDKA